MPPLVSRPPSVRESHNLLDVAFGQRDGALPCMAAPSSLHVLTLACRIMSGVSPPDRVGAGGPDTAVAPVPCRAGPRSTTVEAREGSVVAMRSPAPSQRPRHNSPPLIEQLLPAPHLDDYGWCLKTPVTAAAIRSPIVPQPPPCLQLGLLLEPRRTRVNGVSNAPHEEVGGILHIWRQSWVHSGPKIRGRLRQEPKIFKELKEFKVFPLAFPREYNPANHKFCLGALAERLVI